MKDVRMRKAAKIDLEGMNCFAAKRWPEPEI